MRDSKLSKRALSAAYWLLPSLFCIALYRLGLRCWFQADDFAWLKLGLSVHNAGDALRALFAPMAQGTIRVFSERGFFMLFHALFGMDALPFRIAVFATVCANLVLLSAIAWRITGSRLAGFLAPFLWIINPSLPHIMTWTSCYNEALCGFFILLAFYFFIRYVESGLRRFYVAQWIVFVLGFGALEMNVVYPALAASYALFCAHKYFRATLPMFLVSAAYAVLHRSMAPAATTGVYAMHFDLSILKTLWAYWQWTLGPLWDAALGWITTEKAKIGTALLSFCILGFLAQSCVRRDWLPAFLLSWYLIVFAPLLPLRDHITEYYPYLPSIGPAIFCAYAVARAWRSHWGWRIVACAAVVLYAAASIPVVRESTRYMFLRSKAVEAMLLGVQDGARLHPGKVILLDGVDEILFFTAVNDNPFPLLTKSAVFLTPGTEEKVHAKEWGDPGKWIMPAGAVLQGLKDDAVVVYQVGGAKLRNITEKYAATAAVLLKPSLPHRVDLGSPLMKSYLGPEWYTQETGFRWMPKRASLRMAGPVRAGERLYVTAICPYKPDVLTATVDGMALPSSRSDSGDCEFTFDLPAGVVGKTEIPITLEVDHTVAPPGDGRSLGIAVSAVEIK